MTALCVLAGLLLDAVIILGLSSAIGTYMSENVSLFQGTMATMKFYAVMIIISCVSGVDSLAGILSLSAILPLIFGGYWFLNKYVL